VTVKKVRAVLATAIFFAVAIRILWWAVEPMIPYFIVGFVLISIVGFVVYRRTRW
jgi:hypothetical protein